MVWLPTPRPPTPALGMVRVATPPLSVTVPLVMATPLSLKVTVPVGKRVATGPPAVAGLTVTWNSTGWSKTDGLLLFGATSVTAEVVVPSWLTLNDGVVIAELPAKLFRSELWYWV